MIWVLQKDTYRLGNFINCTPAIRWLSEKHKIKIPVYFETEYVRQCFLDCPFIDILERKPSNKPLFSSDLNGRHSNIIPDYQYIFENVTLQEWKGEMCYVDEPFGCMEPDGYNVIINGAGNEAISYVASKNLSLEDIKFVESQSNKLVFVGSENDLKRNHYLRQYAIQIGDIRAALRLIKGAEKVFANDTGLAHAAGAMNKDLTVFWKHTQFPRCANSGTNTTYLDTAHKLMRI